MLYFGFMKKYIFPISLILLLFCFRHIDIRASEFEKQRIISIAPATTEILFSLGLDDEIIGVTTFCNYPAEALNKKKVGTFSQPNIEKIVSLKPDLIFATGLEQSFVVKNLKDLNLEVYVSHPSNMRELLISIEEIGKVTHRVEEAKELVNEIKSRLEQISEKVGLISQDKRVKVFLEIWHAPLMTAGKGSFLDELITLAGGINIAYDAPKAYSYFSPEQVIKRDPDVILIGYTEEEGIQAQFVNRLGWSKIKAVRNRRVYGDINPDLFLRPGPRLIEGLEAIYNRLYTE